MRNRKNIFSIQTFVFLIAIIAIGIIYTINLSHGNDETNESIVSPENAMVIPVEKQWEGDELEDRPNGVIVNYSYEQPNFEQTHYFDIMTKISVILGISGPLLYDYIGEDKDPIDPTYTTNILNVNDLTDSERSRLIPGSDTLIEEVVFDASDPFEFYYEYASGLTFKNVLGYYYDDQPHDDDYCDELSLMIKRHYSINVNHVGTIRMVVQFQKNNNSSEYLTGIFLYHSNNHIRIKDLGPVVKEEYNIPDGENWVVMIPSHPYQRDYLYYVAIDQDVELPDPTTCNNCNFEQSFASLIEGYMVKDGTKNDLNTSADKFVVGSVGYSTGFAKPYDPYVHIESDDPLIQTLAQIIDNKPSVKKNIHDDNLGDITISKLNDDTWYYIDADITEKELGTILENPVKVYLFSPVSTQVKTGSITLSDDSWKGKITLPSDAININIWEDEVEGYTSNHSVDNPVAYTEGQDVTITNTLTQKPTHNLTIKKQTENNEVDMFTYKIKVWKEDIKYAYPFATIEYNVYSTEGNIHYGRVYYSPWDTIHSMIDDITVPEYDILNEITEETIESFTQVLINSNDEVAMAILSLYKKDNLPKTCSEYAGNKTLNTSKNVTLKMLMKPIEINGKSYIVYVDSDCVAYILSSSEDRPLFTDPLDFGSIATYKDFDLSSTLGSSDDDGYYTFTFSSDSEYSIQIPDGYQYEIIELKKGGWELVSKTNDKGTMTGDVTSIFVNRRTTPDIYTSASDAIDGDKTLAISNNELIKDTITYMDLLPYKEYIIRGEVRMKSDVGRIVATASKSFTVKDYDGIGTEDILFDVDTTSLGGKDLVVYESISLNGEVIANHEDIEDESQTVSVMQDLSLPVSGGRGVLLFKLIGSIIFLGGAIGLIILRKKM